MKACWGFSLDFIPHISGGSVRWHRSDKTAMLDIIIDNKNLMQASFYSGVPRLEEDLQGLLPQAVALANGTWRRGATYHGMLDIIRDIRDTHSNCFGYYNYTQLPLAYAFLSAKTGDLLTAEAELDQYVIRNRLDDDEVAKLKKLARDCAELTIK